MRLNLVCYATLLVLACLFTPGRPVFSQESDPLAVGVSVSIIRRTKPTRRTSYKRPVERAPLLKLEWRLYKVLRDGSDKETEQQSFNKGDRLRLSVRTNQDGYLYVIHQTSPTSPGEVVFPDSRLNDGSSEVDDDDEGFILPSNCPVKIPRRDCALILTSSAGPELLHLFFTRDPFIDLPSSASEATDSISPDTLEKLKNDSGQILRRQTGSTPFSKLLVNINTKDNEDIVETLVLNKQP